MLSRKPDWEEEDYLDWSPVGTSLHGTMGEKDLTTLQDLQSALGQDYLGQTRQFAGEGEFAFEDFYPTLGGEVGREGQALPYYPRDIHPGTGKDVTGTDIGSLDEFPVERYTDLIDLQYAGGGRAGYAGGGITDLRQAYGIGKFVKKIGKKVKKALKNPLVRTALMAYGLKGFGGDWSLGGWGLGKGDALRTGARKLFLKDAAKKWSAKNINPWTAIGIPSIVGGVTTWLDQKDEDEDAKYKEWLAKNKYWLGEIGEFPVGRGEPLYDRSLMPAAQGGRIGYANGGDDDEEGITRAALAKVFRPYGMQEGGLMDMGGMEKDYREEGGFVPIGGQERADDVPARLSKNEFVFTADAVRAAGGGDIDKGAEVMENVMNNLEQGGQVSEESQGLEGARNMFATAQRLEGVL